MPSGFLMRFLQSKLLAAQLSTAVRQLMGLTAASLLAAIVASGLFVEKWTAGDFSLRRQISEAAVALASPADLAADKPEHSAAHDPEFHTFSICAIDPTAGQCGVAVTTRVTQVGRYVPWVRAVLARSPRKPRRRSNVAARDSICWPRVKRPAKQSTSYSKTTITANLRQLGIIDMQGRTANFTGQENGVFAGARQGKNYTVQGNLLIGPEVIDAVADSFEATEDVGMALADRDVPGHCAHRATY